MSQAVSIARPSLGYPALNAFLQLGSAFSAAAKVGRKAVAAVVEAEERSQALFGGKSEAISRLRELANECADEGWDGDGACAVDPLAVRLAESFVRALPQGVVLPEFAPEPDGSISLDWIQSKNRLFSLSVGINNRLAYAWLDGTDKEHAVAYFDGERIPPRILEGITAIMNHGNAPLRVA